FRALVLFFGITDIRTDAAFANGWTAQTSGTTNAFTGASFVDAKTGWAVGGCWRTILRTTNGGDTWTLQESRRTNFPTDIAFVAAKADPAERGALESGSPRSQEASRTRLSDARRAHHEFRGIIDICSTSFQTNFLEVTRSVLTLQLTSEGNRSS